MDSCYKINNKSAEEVRQKVSRVEEKVEANLSPREKLLENEDFQELSEDKQILIWELVKIRENDSSKNQTRVAEQYNVTDAYLSKLKQKIDKLGL